MRLCTFPGCGRRHEAHGLCVGHLNQRHRGQPLQPLLRRYARSMSLEARLLASIEPDTSQWGCWLWTGSIGSHGYGTLTFANESHLAHRAAWTVWRGLILPETPHVLHRCDTRPCIRPDHLFAGDDAANVADMVAKGRARGRFSDASKRASQSIKRT